MATYPTPPNSSSRRKPKPGISRSVSGTKKAVPMGVKPKRTGPTAFQSSTIKDSEKRPYAIRPAKPKDSAKRPYAKRPKRVIKPRISPKAYR